jgi:DNA-binding IclR family transcriptional regulator
VDLLLRAEGASLDALCQATGWQRHSARAFLTGMKKKGYAISSDKVDGVRRYRAVAPAAVKAA